MTDYWIKPILQDWLHSIPLHSVNSCKIKTQNSNHATFVSVLPLTDCDPDPLAVTPTTPSTTPVSCDPSSSLPPLLETTNHSSSPSKEALFTKFARFSPNPNNVKSGAESGKDQLLSTSVPESSSSTPASTPSSSWLNQVMKIKTITQDTTQFKC